MRSNILGTRALFWGMLFCVAVSLPLHAGNSIEAAGDVVTALLPATAAGLTVGFKDWTGSLQLAGSGAVTLAVTYGLKSIVDETRPNGDSRSFPSAHTSVSFASAEFMRKRYGWEFGIPAYAAATFVAVTRVSEKEHYIHDVMAGACIGIVSSYFFTKPYEGLRIQPEAGRDYYGIRLSSVW